MTDKEQSGAYQRGYYRGYRTGIRRAWPEHRPPLPPNEIVARMMAALQNLRDKADSLCATLDESDEWVQLLGPLIDEADSTLSQLSQWLRSEDG